MWFGTEYGINRYDGNRIRTFTEKEGLPDNHIRKIHLDPDGRLWFCCGSFLVVFDPEAESFKSFPLPSDNGEIYDFCFAPEGRIVAGCRFGMYCFDTGTGRLDDGFIPADLVAARVNVFRLVGDDAWLATRDFGRHLYRWNFADGTVTDEPVGPHTSNLNDVLPCGDSLWVATGADGLILRTPGSLRTFTVRDGLCSNSVRVLLKDRSGRLWAGTFKGVNLIENGTVTASFTKEDGSLSHNTVRSICEDSPEGGIWLGNYYFGVDYYHPYRRIFSDTYRTLGDSSLQDELVSCFAVTDGNLFLGVAGKGVWHYSASGITHYSLPGLPSGKDNSNDVKVIYPDPYNGKLYVGAHDGGFTEIDPRSGRSVMLADSDMINTYAVEPRGRDSLVVGTLRGLFVLDKKTRRFRMVSDEIRVRTLRTDSDGNIWAGGENGLAIYAAKDLHNIDLPDGLERITFVYSIFRSSTHELYFVTDNAFFRFNPGDDELVKYDAETLFSDKSVASVAEDSNGYLWLSTNSGICRFNSETGEIRNWSASDGIPCPQFSRNSAISIPDGRMIFGSHKGLVSFYPSQVTDNPYCAGVKLRLRMSTEKGLPAAGESTGCPGARIISR